eukprot:m.373707 g.373707  ORF g.373707 m.373707 type:complete len:150 (+) comp56154_c1_seq1:652-1101(+)
MGLPQTCLLKTSRLLPITSSASSRNRRSSRAQSLLGRQQAHNHKMTRRRTSMRGGQWVLGWLELSGIWCLQFPSYFQPSIWFPLTGLVFMANSNRVPVAQGKAPKLRMVLILLLFVVFVLVLIEISTKVQTSGEDDLLDPSNNQHLTSE